FRARERLVEVLLAGAIGPRAARGGRHGRDHDGRERARGISLTHAPPPSTRAQPCFLSSNIGCNTSFSPKKTSTVGPVGTQLPDVSRLLASATGPAGGSSWNMAAAEVPVVWTSSSSR